MSVCFIHLVGIKSHGIYRFPQTNFKLCCTLKWPFITNLTCEQQTPKMDKLETSEMQIVASFLFPHSVLSPFSRIDVAEQAGSRELMSKAAELRQSISKTEQNLTEATKVCYILLYNF